MTRTYWLSFVKAGQAAGVAVIDVTDTDVEATPKPPRATAEAWADPKVRWMATAIRLSWEQDCNPGGEVGLIEIPPELQSQIPRNRLLTGDELKRWVAGGKVSPDTVH